MAGLSGFLAESWPVIGALGLVALITFGALRPYLKSDARRPAQKETKDV